MRRDLRTAEYESLREEILAYKRQRFDALVLAVTAATALLGYGLSSENAGVFLCVYVVLLPAAVHRTSTENHSLTLASYIRVFHEEETPGWETRLAAFRLKYGHTLTSGLPSKMIGWGIGALGSALAVVHSLSQGVAVSCAMFVGSALLFAMLLGVDAMSAKPLRKRYETGDTAEATNWRAVYDEEQTATSDC